MSRSIRLPFLAVFFLTLAGPFCAPCLADDFRVDNRIFSNDQAKPDDEGTTIFHEGLVYDYLRGSNEAIVFDRSKQQFVLLDLNRRVRSELTLREVERFVARIKQRTAGHSNEMIKFFADPHFAESFDPVTTLLKMQSPWLSYEIRLMPAGKERVAQYQEFSDRFAELNSVLNSKVRPPFARICVDKAIADRHGIAREVHLTATNGRESLTQRSEHDMIPMLNQADRNRVAEFRQDITAFAAVAFDAYRTTTR